jgi:hypothetical protein
MAILRNAQITFRTNEDDKNKETNVTVEVRDNVGDVAARISDPFGLFDDQTTNGPFSLEVLKKEEKALLDGGTVLLRIDPAGDDSWDFNFVLELYFDDGTRLSASADGLQLNEHQLQTQMFGIE